MVKEVSKVTEEYLESIFRLQMRDGLAKTSEIVRMLHVAPGTVTNTINRLSREGFVVHEPYKGVKLTEEGRRIALDVIRRHRLSERLLTDILHMKWSVVHNAACGLEHELTEDIIENLDEVLGHPSTCPHGNPIPSESGEPTEKSELYLSSMNKGDEGRITRISDERTEVLRYFESLGLKPGARIKLVDRAPFEGPLTIQVREKQFALDIKLARTIGIEPCE